MTAVWRPETSVVALTLVMQSISVGILIYSFALFVVPWVDEFSASRRNVMFAVMLSQMATGALSPFAGRAMDRFAVRMLVPLGACVMGLGLVLVSQAQALWQIVLLFATILPAGMVLFGTLASQTLITRWFTGKRGFAMGISAMGTSLGGFLFPPLVQLLIDEFGWRGAMQVLGVATVVLVAPLAWRVLAREPDTVAQSASGSTPAPLPQHWSTAELLRSRMFWLPVIAFIPLNAGFGAVQFNLGAYTADLGYGASSAALLISLTSFAMIVGKFTFGSLGDRIDHRYLYGVAAVVLGFALLAFQAAPSYERMVAGVLMLGFATGASMPLMGVIYASRFGARAFGRVMGLAHTFFMLGAIGPLFAGWVFDETGSYDPAFMALLVIMVPMAAGIAWLPAAVLVPRTKDLLRPQ